MFYYLGKAKGLRERALILKGRSAGGGQSSGHKNPQGKNRAMKQTTTTKVRK